MDICIIQNILSEFPSHSTDMIVKQLRHISALYEVLRILFFQAEFSDISSIVFPRGVSKIVIIAASINTVRAGFESGRISKVKSSKFSSCMTWSLSYHCTGRACSNLDIMSIQKSSIRRTQIWLIQPKLRYFFTVSEGQLNSFQKSVHPLVWLILEFCTQNPSLFISEALRTLQRTALEELTLC